MILDVSEHVRITRNYRVGKEVSMSCRSLLPEVNLHSRNVLYGTTVGLGNGVKMVAETVNDTVPSLLK